MTKKKTKKHAIVPQTKQRAITETFCAQKGCQFYGKLAQQGVCYSSKGQLIDWDRLEAQEKRCLDELDQMRKREGKKYVEALEANYVSTTLNWIGTLDEVVRLRRDIALLKARR